MKKHLNYRYVTFYTSFGKGRACLYISSDKNLETGEINYDVAASFCSPKDTFLKERARKMAVARMEKANKAPENGKESSATNLAKKMSSRFMGEEGKAALTTDDVTNIVFELINHYTLVPTWAKKALANDAVVIGLD